MFPTCQGIGALYLPGASALPTLHPKNLPERGCCGPAPSTPLTSRAPGGGERESRTPSPPSLHVLSPHCPHRTRTWPDPEFAEVHTPAAGGAAPRAGRTPEALQFCRPRTHGQLPFLKISRERGLWSVSVFSCYGHLSRHSEVLHVQTLIGNRTAARCVETCPPQRSSQAAEGPLGKACAVTGQSVTGQSPGPRENRPGGGLTPRREPLSSQSFASFKTLAFW